MTLAASALYGSMGTYDYCTLPPTTSHDGETRSKRYEERKIIVNNWAKEKHELAGSLH